MMDAWLAPCPKGFRGEEVAKEAEVEEAVPGVWGGMAVQDVNVRIDRVDHGGLLLSKGDNEQGGGGPDRQRGHDLPHQEGLRL